MFYIYLTFVYEDNDANNLTYITNTTPKMDGLALKAEIIDIKLWLTDIFDEFIFFKTGLIPVIMMIFAIMM